MFKFSGYSCEAFGIHINAIFVSRYNFKDVRRFSVDNVCTELVHM